ncbi:MAG: NUDIX hydrolase [Microgenomates group bacterium GW2011_GWA2_46_16]|nr:MAG: NUDIX hydrolase [Microgenomates group bacterium GW2011_GWA2_46_16]
MSPPKLLNNVKFLQKCIVVGKDGKILALRRDPNDVRRPNCWDFPGGNYEAGETVDECIKREIREETGLEAKSVRPFYIASNMGKTYQDINVIAVCQVCLDWEGLPAKATDTRNGQIGSLREVNVASEGEVVLSDEHVEYRWVVPDEFMKLETGDDGGFLKASLHAYLTIPSSARALPKQ